MVVHVPEFKKSQSSGPTPFSASVWVGRLNSARPRRDKYFLTYGEPLNYPVDAAAWAIGIGRSTLWELIKIGRVATVKIGRRRLIPKEEVHRIRHGLEPTKDLKSRPRNNAFADVAQRNLYMLKGVQLQDQLLSLDDVVLVPSYFRLEWNETMAADPKLAALAMRVGAVIAIIRYRWRAKKVSEDWSRIHRFEYSRDSQCHFRARALWIPGGSPARAGCSFE